MFWSFFLFFGIINFLYIFFLGYLDSVEIFGLYDSLDVFVKSFWKRIFIFDDFENLFVGVS